MNLLFMGSDLLSKSGPHSFDMSGHGAAWVRDLRLGFRVVNPITQTP